MVEEGLTEEDKQKLFKNTILKLGLITLREAKDRAPVDTGRLRASITLADSEGLIQPLGAEAQAGDEVDEPTDEFTVKVGTNVEYAKYQEFGTVFMSPNSFLRPARDAALNRLDINT